MRASSLSACPIPIQRLSRREQIDEVLAEFGGDDRKVIAAPLQDLATLAGAARMASSMPTERQADVLEPSLPRRSDMLVLGT